MTLRQHIDLHDKEITEIRAVQLKSEQNLTRLEQAMIALVNQQAELARTVERFIHSLRAANGRQK